MADPGYLDLWVYQGASFNTAIAMADVNNAPVNLANLTIMSSIKQSYITSNIAATFTVMVANSYGGVIDLSLSRQVTANLTPKRYVYDVIALDNNTNLVSRILEGTIYLVPSVTTVP